MRTIQLDSEQQAVFEFMESSAENIFVTGKAGSGKSVLLRHFVENTCKSVIVLAPTGLAAIQVGGQTIHSFFAFGFSSLDPDEVVINADTARILNNIDAFIIDEISMVRADVMECISRKFQIARKNKLPFGGVQMIVFGDLYQLPPVVASIDIAKYLENRFGGPFFFNAPAIRDAKLQKRELTIIHRQKEASFQNLLNLIREGNATAEVLSAINSRHNLPIPCDGILTLTTTNKIADEVNKSKLSALPGKEHIFHAQMDGDVSQIKGQLDNALRLKIGAQVMMLRNDMQKRWANGTLGEVVGLSADEIKIKIDDSIYDIKQAKWEAIEHSYNAQTGKITKETVGEYVQYPLCLAWAVTIHKAQGQTHKSVAVDFGKGAFAHGQAYVALSRCQSLDGLYLATRLHKSDIILDERVVDFHCDAKPKPAPPDKKELEMDFHNELLHCTKIIHENGYHAGFIMKMIHEIGGYKTAQRLIKKDPPKGFKNLASRGLLKYSLEALVLQPKYAPLFTDAQIETCRKHLETHGESDSRLVRWAGFGF